MRFSDISVPDKTNSLALLVNWAKAVLLRPSKTLKFKMGLRLQNIGLHGVFEDVVNVSFNHQGTLSRKIGIL